MATAARQCLTPQGIQIAANEPRYTPDSQMRSFTVKLYDGRKKTRIPVVARCWYEAWEVAVNEYGLNVVASVVPHSFRGQ